MNAKRALPGVIYVLAAAGGLSACNLYYSQPVLPIVAESVGVSTSTIAYLPALTQIGFACGILAILPLADMVERRGLVAFMLLLVAAATFAQGVAPNLTTLLMAGFAVGATCIVPQLLTPYAALLAPGGLEGRAVGMVLSGILTGVLISKLIAGIVATALGWRALYVASSVLMIVQSALLWRILPPSHPNSSHRYREILQSTLALARKEPALLRHTLNGAIAFAAFMIFWSNYAAYLAREFGYSSGVAGLFGIAGIGGILAASVAGRQVDRGQFNTVCILSGVLMIVSFLMMLVPGHNVATLIAGVLLLDAGMALCHSANQTSVFARYSEARGRVNAIYMTGYFVGGAVGTYVGAIALGTWGWTALCVLGVTVSAMIPLGQLLLPIPSMPPSREVVA